MVAFLLLSCAIRQNEVIYTTDWDQAEPPSVRVCRDTGLSLAYVQEALDDIRKHGGPKVRSVYHVDCPENYHPLDGTITIHAMFLELFLEDPDRVGVTIPTTPNSCKAVDSFAYSGDCTISEASIFLVDMGKGTLRHELIHALGVLGHSKDDHSPMYVYSRPEVQQTSWETTQYALRRIWRH